jgi:anti-sigma factor RsiW
MKCAEFESTLADYLDGTLASPGRAALEQHAATCSSCAEFLGDVTGAVAFLKRAEEIEPPATLITRIAFQAPLGRTREPFEKQGFFHRAARNWLQPVLQPRLVMGMAMTVLSFAMLERCTGVKVQHIQAADLSPIHVWGGVEDKAVRVKERLVKYYENLRVVYEVETRLKDLEQQQEAAQDQPSARKTGANQKKGDKK